MSFGRRVSTRRRAVRWVGALVSTAIAIAGAVTVTVAHADGPSIASDLPDYAPGAMVTLTGANWQPDEPVHIVVNDDAGQVWSHASSSDPVADASGSLTYAFDLPAYFIANYVVTATGLLSGTATTTFTDSNVGLYDQCSNDDGDGYATGDTGCRWINGNLQSNNSTYAEGDSTVQRLFITGFTAGTAHTVTLQYGTTKGGSHAYDYLTTYNASENWVTLADLCDGIAGCTTAAETTTPIPDDPNVPAIIEPASGRLFTMRGGSLVSATTPAIASGSYAADSETRITVSFTVPASGPMCTTSNKGETTCNVALFFGAHVALTSLWSFHNGTTGAGNIAGSPYHVAVDAVDGAAVGQRDNQMQAGAIVANGTLVVVKDAVPNAADDFGFSLSGPVVIPSFQLDDDADPTLSNARSFTLPPGTYALTELAAATGWDLTQISCVDPSGNSSVNVPARTATVAVASLETVTCTFTNTQRAQLKLVKVVTNDNGGIAVANDFDLTAAGPSGFTETSPSAGTATSQVVNPGAYTLSETGPAGYTGSTWTCSDGTLVGAVVTLAAGDDATCIITNDDQPATLTLVKTVVNDDGGTATAAAFTLAANGPTPISGAGGASSQVNAGTYALSETGPAGYAASAWSCTGGVQSGSNVTLAPGQSATCTIRNDDIRPRLTLVKTVVNDNGGTATVASFPLFVGASQVVSGATNTFAAGDYTASETNLFGYAASAWGGDCTADGSVTLAVGDDKTCTITNDDIAPKLTLVKVVVNDNGGTAGVSSFPLFVSGSLVTSGAQNSFDAGTYQASETTLPGYTASGWSGDCAADGSVTLGVGQVKTCTITNDDQPAHLQLVKVVANDDGGTAVATDFTLSASGPTPISGAGGVESDVSAGTYTLSETSLPGYEAGTWSCVGGAQADSQITLALGESAVCTITNLDEPAHLTLVKTVVNDNGGTAFATDFTLSADGPTPISGAGGAESDVDAGTYDLSESGPAGYAASSWSCVGGSQSGASITLDLGESAICTITNDDIQPRLRLIKTVVNDNGGTAGEADFVLSVSGTTVVSRAFNGFDAGSYTASEINLPGYAASVWGGDCASDGSVTLAIGQVKTCTITNNDIAPQLHLRKVVINDDGGTASASSFTLTADGTGANDLSGTSPVDSGFGLKADTWALSETPLAGYAASAWDCDGGTQNGSNVTLAVGEEATCTITNDDIAPKLTLVKTVVNDNGGTATVASFPLFVGTTSVVSGVQNEFDAGSYTASETTLAAYAASSWGGDCAADGSVTLGLGDVKTCTITNNDIAPQLHLRKVVINDDGGTKTVADFTLTANGTAANDLSGTSPVDSGAGLKADTWALSETNVYGYTASAWSCVGGTQSGSNVTLGIGQEATCTITNDDRPATVVVVKNAKPANGSFSFTTTGTGYTSFVVTGATTNGGNTNTQTVAAGTYTVRETTQLGWLLTGIGGSTDPNTPYNCTVTGSGGSTGVGEMSTQTATIVAKNGDTITCVFENTGQGATRTQGFWQTHPQLAQIAWFGGTAYGHTFPGVAATTGIGDALICGRPLDDLGKVLGGFWSDISRTSTGAKRSTLDQARMQLLQQLLAAELNASAFGSVPSGGVGSFAQWESALCGTNTNAIKNAQQAAASFNSSGDSAQFTPGTSADSKYARSIANIPFWNVVKP